MSIRKHSAATLKTEVRDAYMKGYILHVDFHEGIGWESVGFVLPASVPGDTLTKLQEYIERTFEVREIVLSVENRTIRIVLNKPYL